MRKMTIKQARVIKEVFENKMPIYKARKLAGYFDPKNTQETTRSRAWVEVVKQQLPINDYFAAHRDSLKATKWNDFTGEREKDHTIRLKGVDMAYKAHGLYNMENHGQTLNQVNISWDNGGYNAINHTKNKPK